MAQPTPSSRTADPKAPQPITVASLAVEGTMVALDKPDTRSWTTLPDRVYIARTWLPAGTHKVKISTVGPVEGARSIKEVEVTIPDGGFAAIDFTTLR